MSTNADLFSRQSLYQVKAKFLSLLTATHSCASVNWKTFMGQIMYIDLNLLGNMAALVRCYKVHISPGPPHREATTGWHVRQGNRRSLACLKGEKAQPSIINQQIKDWSMIHLPFCWTYHCPPEKELSCVWPSESLSCYCIALMGPGASVLHPSLCVLMKSCR